MEAMEVPKFLKKAYKELNLDEKVSLIRMAEQNPRMSQAQLARQYEIAKSNVCRILKRKFEYLSAYESWNFSGDRKRKLRDCDTKELNLLVRAWCEESRSAGQFPSGSQIQEKAREIAGVLKIAQFVASNGWLQSFQKSFYNENCAIPPANGASPIECYTVMSRVQYYTYIIHIFVGNMNCPIVYIPKWVFKMKS